MMNATKQCKNVYLSKALNVMQHHEAFTKSTSSVFTRLGCKIKKSGIINDRSKKNILFA